MQAWHRSGAGLLAVLSLGIVSLGQESAVRETEWREGQTRERYEVRIEDDREVRHGAYESWFENGKRASKGAYEDGRRTGAWKFFTEKGKRAKNGRFKNGLRHGKWRFHHANGKLRCEGEFRDDAMFGPWSFKTETGEEDPARSGLYRQLRFTYGEDGPLRGRGYVKDEKQSGEWVYYWPSGAVQFAGEFLDGRREGPWVFHHADGTYDEEMLSGSYVNGVRTKPLTTGELPDFAVPLADQASGARDHEISPELAATLDRATRGRGNQREEALQALLMNPIAAVPAVLGRLEQTDLSQPRELARAAGAYGKVLAAICGGAHYPIEDPETGQPSPELVALATKRWSSLWSLTGPTSDFWLLDTRIMDASNTGSLYVPPFPDLDRSARRWFASPLAARLYGQRFEAAPKELARSLKASLEWLAGQQGLEGGWDADAFEKDETIQGIQRRAYHDVGVSALALLAFMSAGNSTLEGPYRENVVRGLGWLTQQLGDDGTISSRLPENELSYDQALVALCLAEAAAFSPSPGLARTAENAVEWLLRARNEKAGWSYGSQPTGENSTSLTAWMVQALFAAKVADLGVDAGRVDAALEGAGSWVTSVSDRRTGRVGYMDRNTHSLRMEQNQRYPRERAEPMTAAGLFCHMILGTDPKNEIIPRHVYRLKKAPPAWSRDGLSCDMYYWYFGTSALRQIGGDPWERWWKTWSKIATRAQRRKGDTAGSWDPIGPWGFVGGRVYSTAIMTLSLTAPRRLGKISDAREPRTADSKKAGKNKRRG